MESQNGVACVQHIGRDTYVEIGKSMTEQNMTYCQQHRHVTPDAAPAIIRGRDVADISIKTFANYSYLHLNRTYLPSVQKEFILLFTGAGFQFRISDLC